MEGKPKRRRRPRAKAPRDSGSNSKLAAARLRAGKTQDEVADQLGFNKSCLYRWENGVTTPKIDSVAKLARFYGCSIEDLL